jgi:hypothetical protein
MNDESINGSNDLVRWLKMLTLPRWAKFALAVIMLLTLGSALGLLLWGLLLRKYEVISSAVAILTVGLPVGLIVVALVFGDGGASKLKELTKLVLTKEIPEAILLNLASTAGDVSFKTPSITPTLSGCIADYVLSANGAPSHIDEHGKQLTLEFKLELNVRKANLVIWIPASGRGEDHRVESYQSSFFGAVNEGYVHNIAPVHGAKSGHIGHVFIKTLGDDFLLNAGERLYFAQDLAFFIRGLLNDELQNV